MNIRELLTAHQNEYATHPIITALSQGLTPAIIALSQGLPALSHMSQPLSHMSQPLSHMSLAELVAHFEITGELAERIVSQGERVLPEQNKELILALCRLRAWRADELAHLLRREKGYVVRKYLTPMIDAGQLSYTIPDKPRHAEQMYRAAGVAA